MRTSEIKTKGSTGRSVSQQVGAGGVRRTNERVDETFAEDSDDVLGDCSPEVSIVVLDGVTVTTRRWGSDGWVCSIETTNPESISISRCDCGCTLTLVGLGGGEEVAKATTHDAKRRSHESA